MKRARTTSRTRNTMRAWVLASANAANEANLAAFLPLSHLSPRIAIHPGFSFDSCFPRFALDTADVPDTLPFAPCRRSATRPSRRPVSAATRRTGGTSTLSASCASPSTQLSGLARRRASRPRYFACGKLARTLKPFSNRRDRPALPLLAGAKTPAILGERGPRHFRRGLVHAFRPRSCLREIYRIATRSGFFSAAFQARPRRTFERVGDLWARIASRSSPFLVSEERAGQLRIVYLDDDLARCCSYCWVIGAWFCFQYFSFRMV